MNLKFPKIPATSKLTCRLPPAAPCRVPLNIFAKILKLLFLVQYLHEKPETGVK
jgi:hypothetical protein